MEESKNIFERVAEQMEEDRMKAFEGMQSSTKYLGISNSTDTEEIGTDYPQTDYIDLKIAHSIDFDSLLHTDVRFDRIELHKKTRLTDNISTAAISAHAFLLSKRALEVFERFNLGNYKVYPANIRHNKDKHEYGVLHFVNNLNYMLDFAKSSFYISNILGGYEEDIDITSSEDYDNKNGLVKNGKYPNTKRFWNVKLKLAILDGSYAINNERKLVPDIFTIQSSSEGIYISIALAQAIVDAKLTGFEINRVYGIKD